MKRAQISFELGAALVALSLLAACTSTAGERAAATTPTPTPAAPTRSESTPTARAVAPSPSPAPTEDAPASPLPPPTPKPSEPAPAPAPPPQPAPVWPAGATVKRGGKGPIVLALQRRLAQLGYDPGRQDSKLGLQTRQALWAFQHVNGLPADGVVDEKTSAALTTPAVPPVLAAPGSAPDRVEVNIAKQYAVVYLKGQIRVITHISSGSGHHWCQFDPVSKAIRCASGGTPRGTFKVRGEIHAWRRSYLGQLFQPVYFKGGYALHGSLSVPNHPASHGCVRIPMHVAKYLIDLTEIGMPVIVT